MREKRVSEINLGVPTGRGVFGTSSTKKGYKKFRKGGPCWGQRKNIKKEGTVADMKGFV